jgi:hypothetical protein
MVQYIWKWKIYAVGIIHKGERRIECKCLVEDCQWKEHLEVQMGR